MIAAVASFLEARTRAGQWFLRVEDIDPPREQTGATEQILAALEAYGFEWDGPVIYQSASRELHAAALQSLTDRQLAYPCSCSRRDLEGLPQGPLGTIYPGICRTGSSAQHTAVRVLTNDEPVSFEDALQGIQSQRLESESGDFVVRRKDSLIAYQLAVVVDDHAQGITDIVRGIDLMDSTPRQIWLQRLLGYETPGYQHIPVATNQRGQKLSKSFGAGAILIDQVSATLHAALESLGQQPPAALASAQRNDLWVWALENWKIDALRGRTAIPVGHMPVAQTEKTDPVGQ